MTGSGSPFRIRRKPPGPRPISTDSESTLPVPNLPIAFNLTPVLKADSHDTNLVTIKVEEKGEDDMREKSEVDSLNPKCKKPKHYSRKDYTRLRLRIFLMLLVPSLSFCIMLMLCLTIGLTWRGNPEMAWMNSRLLTGKGYGVGGLSYTSGIPPTLGSSTSTNSSPTQTSLASAASTTTPPPSSTTPPPSQTSTTSPSTTSSIPPTSTSLAVPLPTSAQSSPVQHFTPGDVACGGSYTINDYVVSLPASIFDTEGPASASNPLCGRTLTVQSSSTGVGVPITVKVVDRCADCSAGQLQLTLAAYAQIAESTSDEATVNWSWD